MKNKTKIQPQRKVNFHPIQEMKLTYLPKLLTSKNVHKERKLDNLGQDLVIILVVNQEQINSKSGTT